MLLAEFQISDWIFRTPLKFWSGWYITFSIWRCFFTLVTTSVTGSFQFMPYMAWYRHGTSRFRISWKLRSWWYIKHPFWDKSKFLILRFLSSFYTIAQLGKVQAHSTVAEVQPHIFQPTSTHQKSGPLAPPTGYSPRSLLYSQKSWLWLLPPWMHEGQLVDTILWYMNATATGGSVLIVVSIWLIIEFTHFLSYGLPRLQVLISFDI